MYLRIGNKNKEKNVPVELMIYIGASRERGNTGQGFGSKITGALALRNMLEFARASNDSEGSYICRVASHADKWDELDVEVIDLEVQRPDRPDIEVRPTTMLVSMADNAWANNPLGDSYPIVREIILDAADEEPGFTIDVVQDIDFAPPGYTYTYITLTNQDDGFPDGGTSDVVDSYDYYFKSTDLVTWLTTTVGIAPATSRDEVRIFITSDDNPLAYVAFSSGDIPGHTPAYDYVMRESSDKKWASMPKRLLENYHDVIQHIAQAIPHGDGDVYEAVFRSIMDNGFESTFNLPHYGWDNDARDQAMIRVTHGAAVCINKHDGPVKDAIAAGINVVEVSSAMYDLVQQFSGRTVEVALRGGRSEHQFKPLQKEHSGIVNDALAYLEIEFDRDWRHGHLFMDLDSPTKDSMHSPDFGKKDVIGINMDRVLGHGDADDIVIARLIIHEITHHELGDDSGYHSTAFVEMMAKVVLPS